MGNLLLPELVILPLGECSVVLGLELSDLFRLLASVLDLLESSDFFLLEHSDSVAKLLDISLNLKPDGSGLIVGEIFALNVNHDVLPTASRLGQLTSARLHSFTVLERVGSR